MREMEMGRGKIEIKQIEDPSNREITFKQRHGWLLKKANELSILCDSQVGIIIYSSSGRLYEFSSSGTSLQDILARYIKEGLNQLHPPARAQVPQLAQNGEQPKPDAKPLEEKLEEMQILVSRMLGRALNGLTLPDLQQLEQYIMEGFIAVKNRKEQILAQMVIHSRLMEYKTIKENKSLHKQVEDLQRSSQESLLIDFTPTQSEFLPPGMEADVSIGNGKEHEDSDICLHFGSSSRTDDVISRPNSESLFVNFNPVRSESTPPGMEADRFPPDKNVVNDEEHCDSCDCLHLGLSYRVVPCKRKAGRVETVASCSGSGSQLASDTVDESISLQTKFFRS